MNKKRFLIITSSDAKYGNFLINHWLNSLKKCINKKEVQIVVLDYGLTKQQIKSLTNQQVKVITCKRDGHVVNIRFRDMLNFLMKNKFQQILSCDSGDIIFLET